MIFIGIILGLVLGFLISYFIVRYKNRQIRKYSIVVNKKNYYITSNFPFMYKSINDVYFFKTLKSILDKSDVEYYKINMESDCANIYLKTTEDKLKRLIDCINEYETEFYTIKIIQK